MAEIQNNLLSNKQKIKENFRRPFQKEVKSHNALTKANVGNILESKSVCGNNSWNNTKI